MSKHRVAVLKVVTNQSSVTAAAAEHGLSRGHLHRLLRRYRQGGLEALEPRSRQPHSMLAEASVQCYSDSRVWTVPTVGSE